jgi:hypothetical protein
LLRTMSAKTSNTKLRLIVGDVGLEALTDRGAFSQPIRVFECPLRQGHYRILFLRDNAWFAALGTSKEDLEQTMRYYQPDFRKWVKVVDDGHRSAKAT